MEDMKPYRLVRCLSLIFILALNPVYAQDFNAGVDAYLNGDYKKAFDIWDPLATGGDAVAMFNIGVLYSQGLGVPEDLEQGVNWYRQSAIKGYAPAQFNLGVAFREGKGIRKSSEKASQWFRAAAEQDHRHAQYNLASLYWIGDGVEKDREEAITWFEKAAKSGDPRAKQILTRIYETPSAEEPSNQEPEDEAKQALAENPTPQDNETPTDDSGAKNVADTDTSAQDSAKKEIPAADLEETEKLVADTPEPEEKEKLVSDIPEPEQKEKLVADLLEPQTDTAKDKNTATKVTSAEKSVAAKLDGDADVTENNAWIAQQPKGYYTIQVFADHGSTKGSLNFIRSNKLEQANRFVAGGWHKIVVGTYPSREAAKQAVTTLPESVQKQNPWIRLFADVQREMGSAGEQVLSEKASKVEQKLFAATDDAISKANIVEDSEKESEVT